MRWGDGVARANINPRKFTIDLLSSLAPGADVGSALDPSLTNDTAKPKLPFLGVGIDGREPGGVLAGWLVRVQVWGLNPNPVDDMSQELEQKVLATELPATIDSISPVAWYPATTDKRTGLQVGSFTIRIRARYGEPIK